MRRSGGDLLSAPVFDERSELSSQLSIYNLDSQSDKDGTEGGFVSDFLHLQRGVEARDGFKMVISRLQV